jgi:hypothetical protein
MNATRVTEAFNVFSTAQAHVMGIIEHLLDCISLMNGGRSMGGQFEGMRST